MGQMTLDNADRERFHAGAEAGLNAQRLADDLMGWRVARAGYAAGNHVRTREGAIVCEWARDTLEHRTREMLDHAATTLRAAGAPSLPMEVALCYSVGGSLYADGRLTSEVFKDLSEWEALRPQGSAP